MSLEVAQNGRSKRPWWQSASEEGLVGVNSQWMRNSGFKVASDPVGGDEKAFEQTRLRMVGQTASDGILMTRHSDFAEASRASQSQQAGYHSSIDVTHLDVGGSTSTAWNSIPQQPQQLTTIDWNGTSSSIESRSRTAGPEQPEARLSVADSITTQPTLLPRTFNRDGHDWALDERSNPFASATSLFTTATGFITPIDSSSHYSRSNAFSTDDLSRNTMGYSTNMANNNPVWSIRSTMSDNMDEPDIDPVLNNGEGKNHEDDDTTVQSFDSATVSSPGLAPLQVHSLPSESAMAPEIPVETPSTVSTAPSTDDASLGDANLERLYQHRRVPSWEQSPRLQHYYSEHDQASFAAQRLPPTIPGPPLNVASPWGPQMVATFREQDVDVQTRYYPMMGVTQWQQQPKHPFAPQLPFLPGRGTPPIDNRMRPPQQSYNPYHQQHQQQQQHDRKPSGYTQPPLHPAVTTTPPRLAVRGQQRLPPNTPSPHRPTQSYGVHSPSSTSSSNARSPSEILKTLLRKKACLYEPDTSRAIALVTWLVGRELAMEHGFFSRQQLQGGVHACVAEKIEAGIITRTKVNRCMQIILNSCFHYIIPRPDGTEESGDTFRYQFANEVRDDSFLLRVLPESWSDITVDRDEVLLASVGDMSDSKSKKLTLQEFETPVSSPRLGSATPDRSPSKDSDDDDQKRAVLLCFNENVRCAEDVFRCHNEFIRDTAHASHLQLSSQEWRLFFGHEAAGSPYLWGNIGIPVPFSEVHGSSHVDAVGMMTSDEGGKFRTTWCTKRYDHDHELCGFAHAEVNGGWLRRNSSLYQYKDEMCPAITVVAEKHEGQNIYVINECAHGVNCGFAHSFEETVYHPRRYKMRACASGGKPGGCNLGDICPHFHPVETYRFPKKSDGRVGRHTRHSHQAAGSSKATPTPPVGSPILMVSPAPMSSFEQHLHLPGLQSLFRRQCAVVRAHLRKSGCTCYYSYFDDNNCVRQDAMLGQPRRRPGLPSVGQSNRA